MFITNAQRLVIQRELEAATSPTTANAIMELLPTVDWTDVATKTDIARLESRLDGIDARFGSMDTQLAEQHEEMNDKFAQLLLAMSNLEVRLLREQRTFTFAVIGALAAISTVALTIIGLR